MVGLVASGFLAAAVWDLGLSTLLTREVATARINATDALLHSTWLRLRSFPFWLLAYFLSAFVLLGVGTSHLLAATAFAAGSILSAISILPLSAARAHGKFREASTCLAIGRGASLLIALPVLVVRWDALIWIGVALMVGELTVLYLAINLAHKLPRLSTRPTSGQVITLRRALPLAVNGVLATAYNRYDVVVLPALAGIGQLAAYAPASRIQDVLFLLPTAITVVALPQLSHAFGVTDSPAEVGRSVRRFIGMGLIVALPVAALCSLFAGALLAVFLGPHFASATASVRILVWFLPFAVIEAPIIAGLVAVNRAGQTTAMFVVTFGVALLLHLLLDHRFGAVGASFASLARDPAGLVVGLFLARRCGLLSRR